MTDPILTPVRTTFMAAAEALVPEVSGATAEVRSTLERTVEAQLQTRPDALRRQFIAFLRLIERLPWIWRLPRFSRLSPAQRLLVLERLERSRLVLMRRGVWGLRTLVFMGYYTQPGIQRALGYAAHRGGWSVRRQPAEPRPPGVLPITLEMPAVPDLSEGPR